jgi:hypothetical protein
MQLAHAWDDPPNQSLQLVPGRKSNLLGFAFGARLTANKVGRQRPRS